MLRATLRLDDGETAVVGYGSLFSRPSIEQTLGRKYDGPFVIAHLAGWRRTWDVAMPNGAFYYDDPAGRVYPEQVVYLNVRRDPGTLMNCVVFVVRQDELDAMDDREWIYDRTRITGDLRDLVVEGGEAVMYVGRPERIVSRPASARQAAIRATYLRLLESALGSLPEEIRAEYARSTDEPPRALVVDDHLDPERPNPWAAAGRRHSPEAHLRP